MTTTCEAIVEGAGAVGQVHKVRPDLMEERTKEMNQCCFIDTVSDIR